MVKKINKPASDEIKLTNATKAAIIEMGTEIGMSKDEAKTVLAKDFRDEYQKGMDSGWLPGVDDEEERQSIIMDILRAKYVMGGRSRSDFTLLVSRNLGVRASKKQEDYGKLTGLILDEQKKSFIPIGIFSMTMKGSSVADTRKIEIGDIIRCKAGVLGQDGNIKSLIREDESDEIETLGQGYIDFTKVADLVTFQDIANLESIAKPGKDVYCALRITVSDVNKFRNKPGAFMKVFDQSVYKDKEVLQRIGSGFSFTVDDDEIVGRGSRGFVVVRVWQPTKKGTSEPDGFPQGDLLFMDLSVEVPFTIHEKAKKAGAVKKVDDDDDEVPAEEIVAAVAVESGDDEDDF